MNLYDDTPKNVVKSPLAGYSQNKSSYKSACSKTTSKLTKSKNVSE
ncbi:hypothetical protein [Lentilactobacillus curieae]|nr:hypothetical protein [Lentilactobacillus curieae]